MPIHLIFDDDVKDLCKDIIFFTAYSCMVLQVVYLTVDPALVPSCAHLLTVCY